MFPRNKNGEINEYYSLASPIGNGNGLKEPYIDLYGVGMAYTLSKFEKALKDVKRVLRTLC